MQVFRNFPLRALVSLVKGTKTAVVLICYLYRGVFVICISRKGAQQSYLCLCVLVVSLGALPPAGCLHGAVYFLCSELRLNTVFATHKT